MSLVKYRLREVAADFGVPAKEISEIIAQYFEKPKSNTQVLSEDELNVVFDRMTAKHPATLEQVFTAAPTVAKKEEPKQEEPQQEEPQTEGTSADVGEQTTGPAGPVISSAVSSIQTTVVPPPGNISQQYTYR